MNMNWKEFNKKIRSFVCDDEARYFIPLHLEDKYIVVHEDAHDINTGKTFILNKQEIFDKYKIRL